jgi:hypothetical protein
MVAVRGCTPLGALERFSCALDRKQNGSAVQGTRSRATDFTRRSRHRAVITLEMCKSVHRPLTFDDETRPPFIVRRLVQPPLQVHVGETGEPDRDVAQQAGGAPRDASRAPRCIASALSINCNASRLPSGRSSGCIAA